MTEKEFKNKYNELVKNGYFFINHRATANSLGFNSLCTKFNLPHNQSYKNWEILS